ncbi:hypothetical protein BLOT_004805 [Blomia tropicalis]|nr:hypothetical protein BLOT_004805 [Blomia tropicalis]
MATDPFDNFLFNADGINQSFPNQFQQNDDTFDGNGNPFIDAAQLIDIDLMEHCEFSIDNNDIDNDLSKVASYFGRNWPSFENLHLNYINNEKRTTNVECHNASKKILKINVNKNLNLGDISGKICKDKTSNPKSVHFTISQYTRFELDFLRIRNKTDCVVELCFAFSIDKLSSCLLSTSQHNLILHSKIELNQNLGHLIANRCGQIVLQISFLAFCTKKRINSVQTLNCHLNVVSLQIERPLVCTNGQDTIDLTCFEGGPYADA